MIGEVLGHYRIDEKIAESAAEAFWEEQTVDLKYDRENWQRLLSASERAKRMISAEEPAAVELCDVRLEEGDIVDFGAALVEPFRNGHCFRLRREADGTKND